VFLNKVNDNVQQNQNDQKIENEQQNEDEQQNDSEFYSTSNIPELNIFDANCKINKIIGVEWAEKSEDPINEFEEEGLICKSFPYLFPYGKLKKVKNNSNKYYY
jgi:hypothetical protein